MKQLVFSAILLFTAFNAFTQNMTHTTPVRKRFTIGASVGGGVIHFTNGLESSETQGGFSLLNLKLGWFVNNDLAIYLNTPGQIYELNNKDRSFEGYIPSVQYWAADKWWVSGGFGVALDMPAIYEKRSELDEKNNWGKGVLLGTGYEIKQTKKWALDLQAHVFMASVKLDNGKSREGTSFTMGLGFTFY
ncbi:hypothetical protein [Flexithrix dorotheae]|uniref:hypothetical protein n=1 Tax=Flexithrix dorotheae TaxID=70993 RepID=UPI0003705F0D|nr:hypothetical protein [Flexithrix dorotheae]